MVKKVVILGGGISGLVTAYELLKSGLSVEIIEKGSICGGLAKTILWNGDPIDMGPHIYHSPDQDIIDYWNKEFPGLFYERDHWAKNYKNGKFYDYPISEEFINDLPSEVSKKVWNELSARSDKKVINAKNYFDYTRALAGPTLQELFFTKYPKKLWGLDTKDLDANWAPKRVKIFKKRTPFYGDQWSAVGKNGSGTIIESLCEKIENLKGKIHTSEEIKHVVIEGKSISNIETNLRSINIEEDCVVINTLSMTNFSNLSDLKCDVEYRGVILCYLKISNARVFQKGVDFVYVDDEEILFNRVSDQNSFVANPSSETTIACCEITYSSGDSIDSLSDEDIKSKVKAQFVKIGFSDKNEIIDSTIKRLPEVYPMYIRGYRENLSDIQEKLHAINNMYTTGSLAEFAYADLQILFSKGIDLAERVSQKTFSLNRLDKSQKSIRFNKSFNVKNKTIGEGHPTFVIAEIGLNHNGDIDVAKKLIDHAFHAGCDAVKLQSYKSKNRVSEKAKTNRYVEKILDIEETDLQMLQKNELSYEDHIELFDYAKSKNIIIFSAPFDCESVELLESLGCDIYKIASFDLINLRLIEKVASTGKPMIISTGMAYLSEVEEALQVVTNTGNKNIALMQCTSSYPCPPQAMNIKAIDTMKSSFGNLPVGISDHIDGYMVSIAAVARGANLVEKHFTLDKEMEGPDHILSLTPKEMHQFMIDLRIVEESIGDGIKQPSQAEITTALRFRKTMYARKNLYRGEILDESDIYYTGPAFGLYAKYEKIVLGMKLAKDVKEDEPINWEAFDIC